MLLFNFYSRHLTLLVNTIVTRYFSTCGCLLILTDNDNDVYLGEVPVVRIYITNDVINYNTIFNYYGCQGILIYSSNVTKTFTDFESKLKISIERFNNRKYIIISNNVDSFFYVKELNFVLNLLFITAIMIDYHNLIFEFRTHQYVGTTNQNQSILLDKWFSTNKTFLYGGFDLFPDKFTNQKGKLFVMAVIQYEPYSIVRKAIKQHQGSELVSAIQFALHYNMTPVVIVSEKDLWGEIFANWSGTGILGHLVQDTADVGFCMY